MHAGGIVVNGEWPDLSGRQCDALILEEYWHQDVLASPANVVWLQVDSRWHRLTIDDPVVFWRKIDEGPKSYDMEECGCVQLHDLGSSQSLVGETILSIDVTVVDGWVEVVVGFRSGRLVGFRGTGDRNTYYTD